MQGPHALSQLQTWMAFLAESSAPEHDVAYQQFRGVQVYRCGEGMHEMEREYNRDVSRR